jgi:hypothetical protein
MPRSGRAAHLIDAPVVRPAEFEPAGIIRTASCPAEHAAAGGTRHIGLVPKYRSPRPCPRLHQVHSQRRSPAAHRIVRWLGARLDRNAEIVEGDIAGRRVVRRAPT